MMKELVSFVAKSLVKNPDKVEVEEHEENDHLKVVLRVAPEDMGRIIGKNGRTARAIRILLTAAALKSGKMVRLEIAE